MGGVVGGEGDAHTLNQYVCLTDRPRPRACPPTAAAAGRAVQNTAAPPVGLGGGRRRGAAQGLLLRRVPGRVDAGRRRAPAQRLPPRLPL